MNIKLVLLFIIMLFTGVKTHVVNHVIVSDKAEKEYPFDEDSIRYEEVDGKKVHVMQTDSGFVRLDTLRLNIENYFAVCELYKISDAERYMRSPALSLAILQVKGSGLQTTISALRRESIMRRMTIGQNA